MVLSTFEMTIIIVPAGNTVSDRRGKKDAKPRLKPQTFTIYETVLKKVSLGIHKLDSLYR